MFTLAGMEIDNMHSLTGGMAVKMARGALRLEIEDLGSGSRLYNPIKKEEIPELKLWPNPSGDFVNINRRETVSYQIYDTGMRFITSGYSTGGTIDVRKLPAGYYLLFVNEDSISFKPLGFCKTI